MYSCQRLHWNLFCTYTINEWLTTGASPWHQRKSVRWNVPRWPRLTRALFSNRFGPLRLSGSEDQHSAAKSLSFRGWTNRLLQTRSATKHLRKWCTCSLRWLQFHLFQSESLLDHSKGLKESSLTVCYYSYKYLCIFINININVNLMNLRIWSYIIRLGENRPLRQTNKVYSGPAERIRSQGGPSFQGFRNATDDINALHLPSDLICQWSIWLYNNNK